MSAEDILSEEESEALLEQSEDADLEPIGGVREPGAEFFEQVALDRIPGLDAINTELCDMLAAVWKKLFQRDIVVSAQPARRLGGRDLAKRIPFEQSVASFDIQARNEQGLLVVQPDTVSAMVEICFGGVGSGRRSERLGDLTEMERRLLRRFTDAVREASSEIWRRRGGISLNAAEKAFEISASPLCEFSARVVVCSFSFDVGDTEHRLDFVWPATLLDVLRSQQPRALPDARQRPKSSWDTRLREDVEGASVELRAVIGDIPVRLHQISRARPGDIILTEPLTRVRLLAGGKPVFEGTLGTHKGCNAVKIKKPWTQKRTGDA